MTHSNGLLPADLPPQAAWLPSEGGWALTAERKVLARLGWSATGDELDGDIGGLTVRVRLAGRRFPRVRLLSGVGREIAGFTPDWTGLGPVETADGTRYAWNPLAWSNRGGLVRDGAGAGVLRVGRGASGGEVERCGTLPDGHAVALAVLTWAVVLLEGSGPGRVLRVGSAGRRESEEWM